MTATASPTELGYWINDADNHFNEPPDCFERYIDPKDADLAIRSVTDPDGQPMQLFAGQPSKFHSRQVTFSAEELQKLLGDTTNVGTRRGNVPQQVGEPQLDVIPGMLLNRLNPLKDLDEEQRKAFISEFRHKSEAFGNRDLRLLLMDEQGIEKALMFPAAAHDIEYEFADNIPALYANIRAFNRWMLEEVGYNVENRMFLPPYIRACRPGPGHQRTRTSHRRRHHDHPDEIWTCPRGCGQPVRRSLPGRPRLRPFLVHGQRSGDPLGGTPRGYRLPEVRR